MVPVTTVNKDLESNKNETLQMVSFARSYDNSLKLSVKHNEEEGDNAQIKQVNSLEHKNDQGDKRAQEEAGDNRAQEEEGSAYHPDKILLKTLVNGRRGEFGERGDTKESNGDVETILDNLASKMKDAERTKSVFEADLKSKSNVDELNSEEREHEKDDQEFQHDCENNSSLEGTNQDQSASESRSFSNLENEEEEEEEELEIALQRGFLVLVTKLQNEVDVQTEALSALGKRVTCVSTQTLDFFDDAIQNDFTIVLSRGSIDSIPSPVKTNDFLKQGKSKMFSKRGTTVVRYLEELRQYNKDVLETLYNLKGSTMSKTMKENGGGLDCSICSQLDSPTPGICLDEPTAYRSKCAESAVSGSFERASRSNNVIGDLGTINDTFQGTVSLFNKYCEKLREMNSRGEVEDTHLEPIPFKDARFDVGEDTRVSNTDYTGVESHAIGFDWSAVKSCDSIRMNDENNSVGLNNGPQANTNLRSSNWLLFSNSTEGQHCVEQCNRETNKNVDTEIQEDIVWKNSDRNEVDDSLRMVSFIGLLKMSTSQSFYVYRLFFLIQIFNLFYK